MILYCYKKKLFEGYKKLKLRVHVTVLLGLRVRWCWAAVSHVSPNSPFPNFNVLMTHPSTSDSLFFFLMDVSHNCFGLLSHNKCALAENDCLSQSFSEKQTAQHYYGVSVYCEKIRSCFDSLSAWKKNQQEQRVLILIIHKMSWTTF